nr:MAG: ORF2 protein [Jingmen shrew astrovirus 1]
MNSVTYFGGADQSRVMADSQPGAKPKQKKEKKTTTTTTTTEVVKQKNGNASKKGKKNLEKKIKKEVKKDVKKAVNKEKGPKVAVKQQISVTIGTIGPNKTGGVELQINQALHPALAKAPESQAFGPLGAFAAQYGLWRIKYLNVTLTPLVGSSAVSGTITRSSLNLSMAPGGTDWSGLGTRVHMDSTTGTMKTFKVKAGPLKGPREGWWFTDTNEVGSQALGPLLEVHTFGKTQSTYQDKQWEGPLFLVELRGTWEFANYQAKPQLGSLAKIDTKSNVTMTSDGPGQPIKVRIEDSQLASWMSNLETKQYRAGDTNTGEVIFQVVDTGINTVSSLAPPPFGWLIKGGWWFLKKVLNKTRDTNDYYLYASLSDAQTEKPAEATTSYTHNAVLTELTVTQINAPNVGPVPPGNGYTFVPPQKRIPGEDDKIELTIRPLTMTENEKQYWCFNSRRSSIVQNTQFFQRGTQVEGGLVQIFNVESIDDRWEPIEKWPGLGEFVQVSTWIDSTTSELNYAGEIIKQGWQKLTNEKPTNLIWVYLCKKTQFIIGNNRKELANLVITRNSSSDTEFQFQTYSNAQWKLNGEIGDYQLLVRVQGSGNDYNSNFVVPAITNIFFPIPSILPDRYALVQFKNNIQSRTIEHVPLRGHGEGAGVPDIQSDVDSDDDDSETDSESGWEVTDGENHNLCRHPQSAFATGARMYAKLIKAGMDPKFAMEVAEKYENQSYAV